ncbi:unnamed protein product [Phytomonas sp. Hart1]|nr:unnamed protein product [Phytomonas sp. Hart1]|eukprot:CCW71066.1 unnamed protein product [Phytomonas sp. isolate Hart1]
MTTEAPSSVDAVVEAAVGVVGATSLVVVEMEGRMGVKAHDLVGIFLAQKGASMGRPAAIAMTNPYVIWFRKMYWRNRMSMSVDRLTSFLKRLLSRQSILNILLALMDLN